MLPVNILLLLALIFISAVDASFIPSWSGSSSSLTKRFGNARFTYYDAGLGACGDTNKGSDYEQIVALNEAQWAGGKHCGETITIHFGGKSAQAVIKDECPGCPFGALDLTEGLFKHFADTAKGVITGSWEFGGGGGDSGDDNEDDNDDEAKPTSTKKKEETKTTKSQEEAHTPTSTSSESMTTSATPTSTPVAALVDTLGLIFVQMVQMQVVLASGS
ncbi:RlpA-like double-psi beta-barrel-protein domain-containing protein-containing protein [Flagelloscypha sp. PMI_526]|nr:RlpA-like double-psi beta-barrel-protein domain-containing protein-containing protein [Flagelloscypha sp. PMI_526]